MGRGIDVLEGLTRDTVVGIRGANH